MSLNLGGIANVTAIPADAHIEDVFAFDTGPANMLIDALVVHFSRGRKKFDDGARMALSGRAIPALIDELMKDAYLLVKPPKSTGREYYGAEYFRRVLALGKRFKASREDLIRSVTIFTALSVVDAVNRFVRPKMKLAAADCVGWRGAESADYGAAGGAASGSGGASLFAAGSAGRSEGGVGVRVDGV